MISFLKNKLRVTLLGLLALTAAVTLHIQAKAESLHKTIIPKNIAVAYKKIINSSK